MQAKSANPKRSWLELRFELRLQPACRPLLHLVLDRDVRSPPLPVLRAQRAMEGIGKLISNALEIGRHDSKSDTASKAHDPSDPGLGPRPPGDFAEARADLAFE